MFVRMDQVEKLQQSVLRLAGRGPQTLYACGRRPVKNCRADSGVTLIAIAPEPYVPAF